MVNKIINAAAKKSLVPPLGEDRQCFDLGRTRRARARAALSTGQIFPVTLAEERA